MQRPKGTKDIFGYDQNLKTLISETLQEIAQIYNFNKIETPLFEHQEVFVRSVGASSDIVSKEMYQFNDKANRKLVLRPEGTAGVMRAIVENKLYAQTLPLKLYYHGPMFRYENPQKGRQRQFNQFGIELLQTKSPYLDGEVILMASHILKALKIPYLLKINSLGDKETLAKWKKALIKYFQKHYDQLSSDSQNRLTLNPMRILDDKIDGKKAFVKKAPQISEFYTKESQNYFDKLCTFLTNIGVEFEIDPTLVRGLDYYTDTAFEFVSQSEDAGSQNTIIGGGRYHNLLQDFGGPQLSGVGFGIGIERLMDDLRINFKAEDLANQIDVYVLNLVAQSTPMALGVIHMLRSAGISCDWNSEPLKLNKAFAKAAKTKAPINIIIGKQELQNQQVVIKYRGKQKNVDLTAIVDTIKQIFGGSDETN